MGRAAKGKSGSWREIFTRDFLLLATINLLVFFGFQMTTIGMPVYVASLGAEAQVVGLVTTLVTVTALIVRAFSGALLDRFGRKGSLVAGIFIMLCAIVAYAIFPIVGVILGLRLLHGVGWGLGSTATNTLAADVIPKARFAEAMGYFAMTSAIASALAPALAIQLAQGSGAVYMIAVAAGCTAVALVLSFFQAGGAKVEAGAAPGAAPAGQPSASGRPSGPGAGSPSPAGRPPAPAPATGIERFVERRALLPGAVMLLVNMGFGCITTFIALHGQEQGISNIAFYFLVYAATTLVTRPAIGKVIDRNGYRVPGILATLCTAGTLVLVALSTEVWMFALAGVFAGLGIGTAMGTFQSMAVSSVEPWRRGVATSTYMTAFDLGIALGSLLGGVVATAAGYTAMYLVIALFPLAACIVVAAAVKGPAARGNAGGGAGKPAGKGAHDAR